MIKKMIGYKAPQNLILLFDVMAILLLYVYQNKFDEFVLMSGFLLTLIIYASNFILLKASSGDHYIFLMVSMLISISIIIIYRINLSYGFKQIVWFGVGIIMFFIFYTTTKTVTGWRKWTRVYVIISLCLFLITLIFGIRIKGATNWIKIGGFSFQLSEIIKIIYVFFLASYYENQEKIKNKYAFLGIIYGYIAFLFIQRDLGTAMIFYFVFITIAYIFEKDRKLIYYNLAAALVLAIASYFLVSHVSVRVITWIDPWSYIDNKGYQITQSLFAISAGGFFGTGIGLGHPYFIPEVHTDFIFSAICEEMGIFGGIGVIMIFLIFVYRGFKISLKQQDKFFKIIALGMTTMIGFQAFIIIGGVIKLVPLTGVTLPFVSYGGSSLISSFAALGILQVASEELELEQGELDG